ncbi:sugar transferase [Zavarzinella formosa]|uniref:sugar transferase n=1 Tax=Zavarzinella formosa TaxID=360055 RepID=UPI000301DA2F|nr:sugar transferase [Zavarzinella formosa]
MMIQNSPLVMTPPPEKIAKTANSPGPVHAALKRGVHFVLAAVFLLISSPVILLAMILVKLTSPGPAFYSQERLGRNGAPFRIYKIRTMRHHCEQNSGAVWATRNDPRVFLVGRILRKLHIDELPQLYNVLRGDMALVGPRPERPAIAAGLQEEIPAYRDRLSLRPGLTGLAQVQFPADKDLGCVCRKLVADLHYARLVRPCLDFRILIATGLYLLHLPLSWRRRVLGSAAEAVPAPDKPKKSLRERLAAIYELPQKTERIVAVQGLRGVAASLVFMAHFLTLFGIYLGGAADGFAARVMDTIARNGTDIFLLISGFLIYGMCIRRPVHYGRFLRDRMWRIYPAFLFMFVLYLALSVIIPSESKIPRDPATAALWLLENLALLPGLTGSPSLIVVTWTLGYELLLYVTLPLAVRFSGMRNWPTPWRIAALVSVWAAYLAYCGLMSPTHVRLGVYFTGFLAYEAVSARRHQLTTVREGIVVFAAAAAAGLVVLLRAGSVSFPDLNPGPVVVIRAIAKALGMFAVAWYCFGGNGVCGRILSRTPLRWTGNMSYSFYLTHGLALKAAALAVVVLLPVEARGPWLFWVALPLCYLGALAASTALFVMVEKPVSFSRKPATTTSGDTVCEEPAALGETVIDLNTGREIPEASCSGTPLKQETGVSVDSWK